MSRRLLTTFWFLSLLLFTAVSILWVRSCLVEDFVSYHRQGVGSVSAWSRHGRLSLWSDRYDQAKVWGTNPQPTLIRSPGWSYSVAPLTASGRWPDSTPGKLGFAFEKDTTGRAPWKALAIPFWALATFFAIPPALGARPILRRHLRKRMGLCTRCGYDLRASQTRCPECGKPIPQPAVEAPQLALA